MFFFNFFFIELIFLWIRSSWAGAAPRPITSIERRELLNMIKNNQYEEIKNFFTKDENLNIDYPLITFHHLQDLDGEDSAVHGFTPLSAAIYFCKVDVIKLLIPLQYSFKWTTFSAFGYSNAELAAKYCPELIFNNLTDDYENIFNNLNVHQLFNILNSSSNNEKYKDEIFEFVRNYLHPTCTIDHYPLWDDLNTFVDNWIDYKNEKTPSIGKLLIWDNENLPHKKLPFEYINDAALKLLKAGYIEEFLIVLESIEDEEENLVILFKNSLSCLSMKTSELNEKINNTLKRIFSKCEKFRDVQILSENASRFLNFMTDTLYSNFEALGLNKLSIFDRGNFQRIMKKYVPHFYYSLIEFYPRVDLVVGCYSNVHLVNSGDYKNKLNDLGDLIKAYNSDDTEHLQKILLTLDENKVKNLRFNYSPYKLTLIKTAVMQKKKSILEYLYKSRKESLNSSTKFQLTALEMAACYHPEFFVDAVLPLISENCKERLKAANNLIAMFTEKVFKLCPTGAKNAPIVLKALLTSNNESSLKCIDFKSKDYIRETLKLDHPFEMIEALWEIGKFQNIESYIELSIRKGNYRLVTFFADKINDSENNSLQFGLINWIRFTDGLPTYNNIKLLEFFINHKQIDINAHDPEIGSTALTLAVQSNYLWIVKRLLLVPELDVNACEKHSRKTSLHIAINNFNSMYNDMLDEIILDPNQIADKSYSAALSTIMKELDINGFCLTFLDKFKEVFDIILQVFDSLMQPSFSNDKARLEIYQKFKKWMETFTKDEFAKIQDMKDKVQVSPYHGFLHNVLLSHPDIDTTIEDLNYADLVLVSKYRALYLYGKRDAFIEMARAHVRIMNVDLIKGGKKVENNIKYALLSWSIIGLILLGIIRWIF